MTKQQLDEIRERVEAYIPVTRWLDILLQMSMDREALLAEVDRLMQESMQPCACTELEGDNVV